MKTTPSCPEPGGKLPSPTASVNSCSPPIPGGHANTSRDSRKAYRPVDTWLPILPSHGVHHALMKAAHDCLRRRLTPEQATELIYRCAPQLREGRVFQPGEVEQAVAKVYNTPPGKRRRCPKTSKLPCYKESAVLKLAPFSADQLLEASPVRCQGLLSRYYLDLLFPDRDGLLCVGLSKFEFRTDKLSEIPDEYLIRSSFVVPSYMTARTGLTQEGKMSAHAKANTGARRFIVCDFDEPPSHYHARIIHDLARFRKLVMALSSGGKSLHAWFPACLERDDARFWDYAICLGADPALMRNHSSFVRMPAGLRDNGNRQQVLYFDPSAIPSPASPNQP